MTDKQEKKQSIEETFAIIQETIDQLKDASTSLEDSFTLYEQGMKQIAFCNHEIDKIEKKIQILSED